MLQLHDKAHHEGFSDDEPEGHTEVELEAEAEEVRYYAVRWPRRVSTVLARLRACALVSVAACPCHCRFQPSGEAPRPSLCLLTAMCVRALAKHPQTEGAPLRPWWTCLVPCAKP